MSIYTMLAVCDVPDEFRGWDVSPLHPVPGRRPDSVRREHHDGVGVLVFDAVGASMRYTNGKKDLLSSPDVALRVFVTDSRVAVAGSSHGHAHWNGDLPPRLSPPGRRDTMLVGHIRYQWLHAVYAQRDETGGATTLRLFVETAGRMLRVDLRLTGVGEPDALALGIARRAACFRLEHDPTLMDESRPDLRRIADMTALIAPRSRKLMPGVGFPSHLPVSEQSARCIMAVAA